MHHIENAADGFRHDMTQVLSHEFIAPIEREDIIELAQDLDNVVDAIDDVMRRIYMFNVQTIRPEAKQFSAIITKCCHALLETIEEFRQMVREYPLHLHAESPFLCEEGTSTYQLMRDACEKYASGLSSLDGFLAELSTKMHMVEAENL